MESKNGKYIFFFLEFENIYRKELISQNEYKGCEISKEKVQLSQWGKKGFFECDVVIKKDGKLLEVQCLSCSEYKTKNGILSNLVRNFIPEKSLKSIMQR